MNKDQIQQGDLVIERIDKIPSDAKLVSQGNRKHVLRQGEVTGHAHVIEDDVELYEKDGLFYLKAGKEVIIGHEEHKPVALQEGIYEISGVNEFDYIVQMERQVRD